MHINGAQLAYKLYLNKIEQIKQFNTIIHINDVFNGKQSYSNKKK